MNSRLILPQLMAAMTLLAGTPEPARAQVVVTPLATNTGDHSRLVTQHLHSISGHTGVIVRHQPGTRSRGWVALTEHFSIAPLYPETLQVGTRATWSPPKRLLLDRAAKHVALPAFRARVPEDSGEGNGVIIGIIDSGVDLFHPDLRTHSGETRASWWLDFGSEALGFHSELEADLGCTGSVRSCAILGPQELAALVDGRQLLSPDGKRVTLPNDPLGHGTHVASLAAGNGSSDADLVGIAPGATLIVARVAGSDAIVDDIDVALATRFVFERAEERNMPAVANLSLGGDFGPHDGSSTIAQVLQELIGPKHPGRAIVVAAGNSAGLEESNGSYPGPLGIHTQVHLPQGASARVPLLTPAGSSGVAAFFIWVDTTVGHLNVGLERLDGSVILPPLAPGEFETATELDGEFTIVNQSDSDGLIDASDRGAAILATGRLESNSAYVLRLEGEGLADVWVQSGGLWSPGLGTIGARFPRATKAGTVNIPADAPDLISVGATLNRLRWSGDDGAVPLAQFTPELDLTQERALYFSSLGPGTGGSFRPDVLAPGGVIIGAMSNGARPLVDDRVNGSSMFFASPTCEPPVDDLTDQRFYCAVVDEYHAVSLGTSMAAPLVSGTVALLLEQDPRLTQPELQALLRAGASRSPKDPLAAAGLLNVAGSFEALEQRSDPVVADPDAKHSWVNFADVVAYPNEAVSLDVLVRLRDSKNRPVAESVLREVSTSVNNGELVARKVAAPGLITLRVRAGAEAGGQELSLTFRHDGRVVARGSLPVAVDRSVDQGVVTARAGCSISRTNGIEHDTAPQRRDVIGWLMLSAGFVRRGRKRRGRARA